MLLGRTMFDFAGSGRGGAPIQQFKAQGLYTHDNNVSIRQVVKLSSLRWERERVVECCEIAEIYFATHVLYKFLAR